MPLNIDDIDRLSRLARLRFSTEEGRSLLTHLNGFFDIVTAMQKVDTEGVIPLAHPVEAIQTVALRLADDRASQESGREANQRSAPAVAEGLFLVPRVIE